MTIRSARQAYDIASAAGWDAGNTSKRKAGRTKWNEDDYNTAAQVTNQLLDHFGFVNEFEPLQPGWNR